MAKIEEPDRKARWRIAVVAQMAAAMMPRVGGTTTFYDEHAVAQEAWFLFEAVEKEAHVRGYMGGTPPVRTQSDAPGSPGHGGC